MSKEAPKVVEKKPTFPDVFRKFDGKISISTHSGFAHIEFEEDGKMFVTWLNDEGYVDEDGQHIPLEDITRVADFMRELKELRLEDYKKP